MHTRTMENKNQRDVSGTIMSLYKVFHYSFSVVLFSFCWIRFRYGSFSEIASSKAVRYDVYIVILFTVLFYFFSRTYHTYLIGYVRIRQLVFSQFLSQAFSAVIIICAVSVAWMNYRFPTAFVIMLVSDTVFDCFWSWTANTLFYKLNPQKKAIIVYGDKNVRSCDLDITGKPIERLILIEDEILCTKENIPNVLEALEQFDVFFAVGISDECTGILSLYCKEKNKDGFFIPNVGEIIFRSAYHIQSFHEPILTLKGKENKTEYLIAKRAFDIIASIIGIIVFSPLMLATAISIKAFDGGPVLYKQRRLTLGGREFSMLKFRSMNVDAEKDGEAVLSSGKNDSRITPVGRIIRAVRLDELPQLFNILIGDMTFVGPRPERPEIADKYYETLPEFRLRLQVKAGLTGYAQVYGKYNTSPEQKLKFDLMYINSMNMMTDIKLVFATLEILFSGESTEGIEEETTV